jgi:hypothetical protein
MKTLVAATLLAACASASAQVSVTIGQPGFYGRIDLGGFAPPPVLYAQPVIVERRVRTVEQQPLYLRVPPGHAKHWAKHCRKYNACAQPVLFVQDRWYTDEYAPRVRAGRRPHGSQGVYPAQDGRGDYGRGERDGDRGHGRGDEQGNGNGHGNGHGNGNGNGNGHGKGHGKHD